MREVLKNFKRNKVDARADHFFLFREEKFQGFNFLREKR